MNGDQSLAKPAIEGGQPVRHSMLPYGRQAVDEDDIAAVVRVLRSDYLTTGPAVREFEARVAAFVGARYAVAFANGTAALHGAAFAAGVEPGDEVITTPITFAASANCVLYMGGRPVFADVDPDTLNISPAAVADVISPRTKAVIPVHYTGHPVDIDEIAEIARARDLIVIEDAAHALGASYKGGRIGSHSHMVVFSFHPVKPVTTGEGGAVVTNDPLLYERLCLFRSHGITREPDKLTQRPGAWYYEMQALGFNYRLTDIQAALGLSQMDKLPSFIDRRNHIAARLTEAFHRLPGVMTPTVRSDRVSGWHLYVLRFQLDQFSVGRDALFAALLAENIGVNLHYIPVYLHPYYQRLGYRKGLCPQAEAEYERMITLPLFPGMTDDDIQDVIRAVEKVVRYYRIA